ncbi:PREDICTED: putative RNA polymerase II subunit B1 CTD phosphatase RPAP2 [Gekko japonicus]|uniref:RNA polymerase II subunit B1 CTD phosphatase RPAP2 homolog n=1 Tax=Gekko japonicus TaxID=146911 RepID=A0ABM1KTC0_GEKJA|nr:PREDICTED: putative RNA polymerase II subunit B1 CTD phosphatase RPAP2 [Gekko japonicus]
MAEEKPRSSAKSRHHRRRSGNKQTSTSKNEDAAQRRAALEAAIRKKIEYERKALCIVQRLLEDDITEEFLVNCGKYITPSHYKDVVEERFIIKLCGYPICRKKLENVPKQKYRISTKTNKVYDISERKCFCSNFCYRASKYFEGQISKSPLWLQEEERPPDIKLLKEGESGHSGKEVKFFTEAIRTSDIEATSPSPIQGDLDTETESSSDAEQEFVSFVLADSLSGAKKLEHQLPRRSTLKKKHVGRVGLESSNTRDAANHAAEELSKCELDAPEEKHAVPGNSQGKISDVSPETRKNPEGWEDNSSGSSVVFLGVSKNGAEKFKRLLAKSKQPVPRRPKGPADSLATKSSLLGGLQQTFTEWRTEETLKLLHGSSSVATQEPAVSGKEELDEDDFDSTYDHNDATSERGLEPCLDLSLPIREPRIAAAKPLPSYEKLREDTALLELRVKEFYEGKVTLAEEGLMMQPGGDQHHSNDKDFQQWTAAFPLVDSNAQQQIRRRIVLEKLQKVLPSVLGPLHIPLGDVDSELKNLVKTFALTNKNIIHKTPEWTLIALVLLSVLSQSLPAFVRSQQSPVYTQFITTLFEALHFTHEDFESLTRLFGSDCFLH